MKQSWLFSSSRCLIPLTPISGSVRYSSCGVSGTARCPGEEGDAVRCAVPEAALPSHLSPARASARHLPAWQSINRKPTLLSPRSLPFIYQPSACEKHRGLGIFNILTLQSVWISWMPPVFYRNTSTSQDRPRDYHYHTAWVTAAVFINRNALPVRLCSLLIQSNAVFYCQPWPQIQSSC